MNYDLEERTAKFAENVIDFVRSLKRDEITKSLITQIVKSSTSIGANYMEANQASSKKDFRHKIQISRKESNETKHWIRMIARAVPETSLKCKELWSEAHALTLIFAKISKSSKEN